MAYHIYAVRMKGTEKERFYIQSSDTLEEAKHIANCCVCGDANYAYVKDSVSAATIFYLEPPKLESR